MILVLVFVFDNENLKTVIFILFSLMRISLSYTKFVTVTCKK